MILLLSLLLSTFSVWSASPDHWAAVTEIVEKHEFYKPDQEIASPKDAWQTLFAVAYITRDFRRMKDCVYYKVPGTMAGSLKIKAIEYQHRCDDYIFTPADREIGEIKSLRFSATATAVKITFALPAYKHEEWWVRTQSLATSSPEALTSSAEYKAPKVILLAPATHKSGKVDSKLVEGLCHDINESCEEVSPSRCSECAEGWFEVPSGCIQGPKYCGRNKCGQKNEPACRRGMKYQHQQKKFECRGDNSFAYCSPGLVIQCEGNLAYCR